MNLLYIKLQPSYLLTSLSLVILGSIIHARRVNIILLLELSTLMVLICLTLWWKKKTGSELTNPFIKYRGKDIAVNHIGCGIFVLLKLQNAFYFFSILFLAAVIAVMRYFENLVFILKISGQNCMGIPSEGYNGRFIYS
jgi:hypothetical protein